MIQLLANLSMLATTGMMLMTQSCNRTPIPEVPITPNVKFESHIRPITSTVCIECHSKGSKDYSQYKNAFSMRYSIKDRVVISKTMSLGRYLSEQDRALFRDWVDQGGQK